MSKRHKGKEGRELWEYLFKGYFKRYLEMGRLGQFEGKIQLGHTTDVPELLVDRARLLDKLSPSRQAAQHPTQ